MENESEYFLGLTAESKKRYHCKVTSSGLNIDPYSISSWTEDPSALPDIQWSDMMLYMVSTPSPYTRDEIKVIVVEVYRMLECCMYYRLGKVCWMEAIL